MQLIQPPVFFKKQLLQEIDNHVKEYQERGYDVRSKIMFYTPYGCRKPQRVQVLVRCFKIDKFTKTPKMTILRVDGQWK